MRPYDGYGIADFLAKPYIAASGSISTADTANTTITSISISDALAANVLWTDKLRGYRYIRGTAVVKLVINANPFQSGRLISTFLPMYRHLTTSEQAIRNVTLSQVTTQPNVELNIQDSSSIMYIPYVAPTTYYDLKTTYTDWGTYFLKVLTPLRTGSSGETSFKYDLFVHFEDVELAGPINPESAIRATQSRKANSKRSNVAAVRRGESANVSSNSLSAISGNVSKAAGLVAGSVLSNIPGVALASNLVGSIAGVTSDIASLFGWSKPLITSSAQPLQNRPFFQMQNNNSGALVDSLAFNTDPTLPPAEQVYGSSDDEMSFAFLKTIPALLNSGGLWTDSDVAGTALMQMDLDIKGLVTTGTKVNGTATTTYTTGQPLFMLASQFSAFKGGVVFTFKFVKTAFHSGRLAITFTPNAGGAFPSLTTSAYAIREIIDLKDSDSVQLTIPYMQPVDYLSTDSTNAGTMLSSLGKLTIHVVTQLRVPETASNTVTILTYVQPADDFELAAPCRFGKNKFWPFTPESALSSTGAKISKQLGNSALGPADLESNALCFADPFLSIKQLLLVPNKFMTSSITNTDNNWRIFPFARSIAQSALNITTYWNGATSVAAGDNLSNLSAAYAFERGSVRIMNTSVSTGNTNALILPHTGGDPCFTTDPVSNAIYSFDQGNGFQIDNQIASAVISRDGAGGALDALMPHWGKTPMRPVRYQSQAAPLAPNTIPGSYSYDLFVFGRTFDKTQWYRAVGDDYTLGYFIGFPPMAKSIA